MRGARRLAQLPLRGAAAASADEPASQPVGRAGAQAASPARISRPDRVGSEHARKQVSKVLRARGQPSERARARLQFLAGLGAFSFSFSFSLSPGRAFACSRAHKLTQTHPSSGASRTHINNNSSSASNINICAASQREWRARANEPDS